MTVVDLDNIGLDVFDRRKAVMWVDKMTDGPFKNAFDADTAGVVRREIVTYRIKNGVMIKETAVRDYYANGDYHDSQNALPLVER